MSKRNNTSEVDSNYEEAYQEGYNEGFDEAFMPGVILGVVVLSTAYVGVRKTAQFVARKIEEKKAARQTAEIPAL